MDDQLRPVETDRAMDRAQTEAGYAPTTDYVARHTPEHQHEIDLLDEVAKIVRQAKAEYEGGHAIAARLEIIHAHRILDRAYSGDRV